MHYPGKVRTPLRYMLQPISFEPGGTESDNMTEEGIDWSNVLCAGRTGNVVGPVFGANDSPGVFDNVMSMF